MSHKHRLVDKLKIIAFGQQADKQQGKYSRPPAGACVREYGSKRNGVVVQSGSGAIRVQWGNGYCDYFDHSIFWRKYLVLAK